MVELFLYLIKNKDSTKPVQLKKNTLSHLRFQPHEWQEEMGACIIFLTLLSALASLRSYLNISSFYQNKLCVRGHGWVAVCLRFGNRLVFSGDKNPEEGDPLLPCRTAAMGAPRLSSEGVVLSCQQQCLELGTIC